MNNSIIFLIFSFSSNSRLYSREENEDKFDVNANSFKVASSVNEKSFPVGKFFTAFISFYLKRSALRRKNSVGLVLF